MKKLGLLLCMLVGCQLLQGQESDDLLIAQQIEKYDAGWDEKNVEKVLSSYADEIDWTNAFGDRTQGKEELKGLLETIFGLDFVMTGKNNYQAPEITYLNDTIALARSVNIRSGQLWPDGSPMKDRIINHLWVFQKKDGVWLCVHHMISQAHEKRG